MKSDARNPWGVIGFSILTLGFRWLIFGPKHVCDFMFFLVAGKQNFPEVEARHLESLLGCRSCVLLTAQSTGTR